MRKHGKKIVIGLLCVSLLLSNTHIVRADDDEDTNIDFSDGNTYFIQSDGQDGYDQEQNTDINTNVSTGRVRQLTQAERNTSNRITTARRDFASLRDRIRNENSSLYGSMFGDTGTNGTDILNFGAISISREEYAQYLNNILNYALTINDETGYFDRNTMPRMTLPDMDIGSYQNLSPERKTVVKNGIAAHEKGESDLRYIRLAGGGFIIDPRSILNFGNFVFLTQNGVGFCYPSGAVSGGSINPDLSGIYNELLDFMARTGFGSECVRRDIFGGFPALTDSSSYRSRYRNLLQRASEEQWPIDFTYNVSVINGNITGRSSYVFPNANDPRWSGVSNSLSDQYYIALLTDYHIDSCQTDYISNINYTSDERRWTIIKDGQPVSEPMITDNPYHELNFTEVYQTYGPGHYDVRCEQYATYMRSIYVRYSTCDYLFDVGTGTILWYSESLVSSGHGTAINLGTEQEEGWIETGDTFSINVNDLGTVEVGESGTDRVD